MYMWVECDKCKTPVMCKRKLKEEYKALGFGKCPTDTPIPEIGEVIHEPVLPVTCRCGNVLKEVR